MAERKRPIGPDRIQRVTQVNGHEPVVTSIMDVLPLGRINYGARPPKAENPEPSSVLPESLTRLDLRSVGDSRVTIQLAGEEDPRTVTLDEVGKGVLPTGEDEVIEVYAAHLVAAAKAETATRPGKRIISAFAGLSSENGVRGRDTAAIQDTVVWGAEVDKKGKTSM
jgi:hypothetical protein